ncbi:YeeE/YedE family protein [Pontibacterium sp.]|uniref:YeeE/YedE family protein n=1 Tax=Pontibacterium sp. TaxID=2036026 RepID=UPI00356A134A
MSSVNTAVTDTSAVKSIESKLILIVSFALLGGGLLWLQQEVSEKQALLLLVGTLLGITLYHAAFGFTTAWRNFIINRRGKGLRAQMLMLAVGVCLFFPALSVGELFGTEVRGFIRPLGWSVLVGAFIFGIGMQLGNGCASGNLYHVGGGQLRAIPSMIGFTVGALWATKDYEWWTGLPQIAPVSLVDDLGVVMAIIANLALFAAIAAFTFWLEKRYHGNVEKDDAGSDRSLTQRLVSGPWPFIWGAVALALLNFVTLAMIGNPWAVAVAYPLWGAKLAMLLELELELDFWTYWLQPGRETALGEPLQYDAFSVINIGVVLGALMAASLAGKFSLQWRLPWQHWLAAILGGLMLGYGATIAFGCNIGAYFGGIVSGSLHGWLWLVAAFVGSLLGTYLRPLFALPNEAGARSSC